MGLSIFNIIFLLAGLALGPVCHSVKITRNTYGNMFSPTFTHFTQHDWELEPNQVVPIYTQKHDEKWGFAFIAHVPSEQKAEVVVAQSIHHQTVCKRNFAYPEEGKIIFYAMKFLGRNKVEVEFDTAGNGGDDDREAWEMEIDTSVCAKLEDATAAAPSLAAPQEKTSDQRKRVTISHTATDVLEPEVVNSTAGYVFTRINNGTDPTTSIIFENEETGETTVLGTIQAAANNRHQRESHANNKYGLCMMEEEDVLCMQQSRSGQIVMNYTHLDLEKPVDFFDVHNLKASAMLVVTTECPDGKCSQIKVRKIQENDKISKEVVYNNVGLNCEDPLTNLKMFTTDVQGYKYICFNFVCTDNGNNGRKVLQYRNYCTTRDYFESN